MYYIGHILGLHRNNGKENGNYYSMLGLHIAMQGAVYAITELLFGNCEA